MVVRKPNFVTQLPLRVAALFLFASLLLGLLLEQFDVCEMARAVGAVLDNTIYFGSPDCFIGSRLTAL